MRAPGLLNLIHEGDYTVVEAKDQHNVYKDYEDINSGRAYDEDLAIRKALREHYNELNLTVTVASNGMSFLPPAPGRTLTLIHKCHFSPLPPMAMPPLNSILRMSVSDASADTSLVISVVEYQIG